MSTGAGGGRRRGGAPAGDGGGRHVAFLRAINVAGHASVKMEDLKRAFAAAGCRNVQTYIQSGNVIFESSPGAGRPMERRIRESVARLLGGEGVVIFRSLRRLAALVEADPFGKAGAADVKLFVAFLAERPRRATRFPMEDAKECLKATGIRALDVLVVSGRKKNGFYGFPNSFIEKELGVAATSRSWNTLLRIVDRFS